MTKITRRRFVKGAAIAPLAAQHLALAKMVAAPSDRYDIVVAGAGHNSLITAAYLAKAGYRCLVLEGRPKIGGGVKTAELTLKFTVTGCPATDGLGVLEVIVVVLLSLLAVVFCVATAAW